MSKEDAPSLRHVGKDVRSAVKHAVAAGWVLEFAGSSHRCQLRAPDGTIIPLSSGSSAGGPGEKHTARKITRMLEDKR